MGDLKFFSLKYPYRELAFDLDGEYYTIDQYKKWFVRYHNSSRPNPPLLKAGESFIELVWDKATNGYLLPENTQVEEATKGVAGLLTLYSQSGQNDYTPLVPSLYVGPGNISDEEFSDILDRLGLLAVAHESGLLAPITLLTEDTNQAPNAERASQQVSSYDPFIALIQAIQENWDSIKRNPAKEIKLVNQIVDSSNPNSQRNFRAVQSAVQKPYQKKHNIPEHQENFDTIENQFLLYVLKEIVIRRSKPLADFIRKRAARINSIQSPPYQKYKNNYLALWQDRRVSIKKEVERLNGLAEEIEKRCAILERVLAEPFLQGVKRTTQPVINQSATKIILSKEYGPIYTAYQNYLNGIPKSVNSKRLGLIWALDERAIRPTQSLYEIWVFLEIYGILINTFGFNPISDNLLDSVFIDNGELLVASGSEFVLTFTPKNFSKNTPLCKVTLAFTPSVQSPKCKQGKSCYSDVCKTLACFKKINQTANWKILTPDITITVEINSRKKIFVLDAKYRKYEDMRNSLLDKRMEFGVDSVFHFDLLVTAKMKYLNGLGTDASFILHTDPNPAYTYLGNEPFPVNPHREAKLTETYHPAHKIGAIYVTPKHLTNLEKVLRSFLMYHSGLENICWSCQNHLTQANGGMHKETGWQGDYYQCPDCGRFWIVTNCQQNRSHKLIKLGKDSFHKTAPGNEWNCICPACGDNFTNNEKRWSDKDDFM